MGTPSRLDKLFIRNNAVSFMRNLEQRVFASEVGDIEVRQLSDFSEDLGTIYVGNFIAGTGDPFDQVNGLFTGSAMVYPPITIGADDYNIFGQNLGVLEFGISSTDGRAYFAAGAGIIDHTGIILRAETYPATTYLTWKAQDTGGVVGAATVYYGGAAVNTGLVFASTAHDSGVRSYVALWAQDYAGVLKSFLAVDTNGSAIFDFTAVVGPAGGQSLLIKTKTSSTNALNNLLYCDTDSSGTPAAGLGSAIAFRTENSAAVMKSIGYIGIPYLTTTNGAEDSKVLAGMVRKGVSFSVPLGGAYADHFVNVGNVTTTETDLYTDTLIASLLAENGDKIVAEYSGVIANHATATRQVRVYFGGTVIFDSTALVTSPGAVFSIRVVIIRQNGVAVRAFTFCNAGASFAAPPTTYVLVTGLTLSNAQIIKITGQAAGVGAATNDIVARAGMVYFYPAA